MTVTIAIALPGGAWAQGEAAAPAEEKPAPAPAPAAEAPAPPAPPAKPKAPAGEEPNPFKDPASQKELKALRTAADATFQTGGGAISLGAEQDAAQARNVARRFFNDLILGDARELVSSDCGLPFYVEDRKFSGSDELMQEWLKDLREKRTDLLTLYGIELLTPQEMEKKYGKPPARLANFPWRAPHTYVAVANLSGHAGVAVVSLGGRGWRVVGYHD